MSNLRYKMEKLAAEITLGSGIKHDGELRTFLISQCAMRLLDLADEAEHISVLLAEAERLCIDHCPEDMSEALTEDWKRHTQ